MAMPPYQWRGKQYKTVRGLSDAMHKATGATAEGIRGAFLYARFPSGAVCRYLVTGNTDADAKAIVIADQPESNAE